MLYNKANIASKVIFSPMPEGEAVRMPEKVTVLLRDIADKLDEMMDSWEQYLNTATGDFVTLSDGLYVEADEELAEEIESSRDYVRLPNQHEIREYDIMEEFADTVMNVRKRERLFQALGSRKPFRHFKNVLYYTGLDDAYYAFRSAAYIGIAKRWCEDNDIPYVESNVRQ